MSKVELRMGGVEVVEGLDRGGSQVLESAVVAGLHHATSVERSDDDRPERNVCGDAEVESEARPRRELAGWVRIAVRD